MRTYSDVLVASAFLSDAKEPISEDFLQRLGLTADFDLLADVTSYSIPAPADPRVMWLELMCDMLATYALGRPYLIEVAHNAAATSRRLYSKACLHLPACRAVLSAMDLPGVPLDSLSPIGECGMDLLPMDVFDEVARRVVALGRMHGIKAAPESVAEDPDGLVASAHSRWAQKGML